MIPSNLDVTDLPWSGRCATSGLTVDEFADLLAEVDAPQWVKRAAVGISRSYPSSLRAHHTDPLPVAHIARVIDGFRRGDLHASAELMERYRADEKLEHAPQYDGEEPWVREAGVTICHEYGIRGLCDPLYIANRIRGEEIDADHPGDRYRRHS